MTIQVCLQILGLDDAQDLDQLHRAYRHQVKRWHPDQFTHQPAIHAQAEERLKRINHAYSILKEHFNKKPSAQPHVSTANDKKTQSGQKTNETKFTKSFQWSQWFKQKNRQCHQNHENVESNSGHRLSKTACAAPKKPNFEQILQEAADNPCQQVTQKRFGMRSAFNPHLRKQGKRNLRIKGFKPVSPITPIRPISKINGIEGSD
jgi:curved DNA-binding protein CbpA